MRSPLLRCLKEWLADDEEIKELSVTLAGIHREIICKK